MRRVKLPAACCLALGLLAAAQGCYPDEGAAVEGGDLRISLAALGQPVSSDAFDAYLAYLRGSMAYEDFDFNVAGHDVFLGLHLVRVLQEDPLREEEVAFGAEAIRLVSDPTSVDQRVELELVLPECADCYFSLKLFARAQGPLATFVGTSERFDVGPGLSPPAVAMDARLVADGLARCRDDAPQADSVRLSARDVEERVRLPEVWTSAGAAGPEATLRVPAAGPFELQFFHPADALWESFAQVAFSYADQEMLVHFDSSRSMFP